MEQANSLAPFLFMILELFNPYSPPSLYIHTPFCKHKCDYCSFYSFPLSNHNALLHKAYFKRLINELKLCKSYFKEPFKSVYIGGGTPNLEENLEYLAEILPLVSPTPELTIECNVSSLNPPGIELFSSFATRLSVGVQSFSKKELDFMGRKDSTQNLFMLFDIRKKSANFPKINLDFIAGSTNDKKSFTADFGNFVSFCHSNSYSLPEHISLYMLTIENNTPLERLVNEKKRTLPDDDTLTDILQKSWQCLESYGYEHYETSAFARELNYCIHNLNYWNLGEYLALGASGASRCFWKNPCEIYFDANASLYAFPASNAPFADYKVTSLTKKDVALEMILTGFRTIFGVNIENFNTRTSFDLRKLTQGIEELEEVNNCIRIKKDYMIIAETFIRKVCMKILSST